MLFARGFFILLAMSADRKKELLACFGLVFATICWGISFVFVKTTVEVMPPLYLLGIRFLAGGVIIALIFWRRFIKASTTLIVHGSLIGLLLFTAEVFQTYGIKYTTAGKNAFLTAVYVILVPFFHYFFNKVKPRLRYVIAAVIGFWGIGLISLTEDFTVSLGDWLTLVCGIFYAFQIILISVYAANEDPIVLVIWEFLITGVLSFAAAPFVSGAMASSMFTFDSVIGLAYLIVFSTILGYGLQLVCQKYAPPAPAAIIMGMEAVFGALASYILLGETMTQKMITGCVMMVAAMMMVEIDIIGYFYPDEYVESAYVIDYEKLYSEGIRGLIFDIDNTLVMHDHPPDDRSVRLLGKLEDMGFKVTFLSNNKEERVRSFRDGSDAAAFYIHKAGKPKRGGYVKAMEMMGTDRSSTVFIGDQLFTDLWGAKRSGMRNILVHPIDPHEEIQIILKRIPERVVLSSYLRKNS